MVHSALPLLAFQYCFLPAEDVAPPLSFPFVKEGVALWLAERRFICRLTKEEGAVVFRQDGNFLPSLVGVLILHLALLVIGLAGVTTGLFGYRGNVSLIEGQSFRDTREGYSSFWPGILPLPFGGAEFTLLAVLPPPEADFFGFPDQVHLEVSDAESGYIAEEMLQRNISLLYRGLRLYPRRLGYAPQLLVSDNKGEPLSLSFVGLERKETGDGIIHADSFSLPGADLRLMARFYPPSGDQIPLLEIRSAVEGTSGVIELAGEGMWVEGYYLTFTDIRRYQRFHVVRDIGIYFFAIGSLLFLLGAGLYYFFLGRQVIIRLKQEGEELAISGIFRGLGQHLLEREFALFLAELAEGG